MIDYIKINQEYDKIHKRLDELEERYQVAPPQRKIIESIIVAEGLPLHIRCFLLYRVTQLPDLKWETLSDSVAKVNTIVYCDPYELPSVARRINFSYDEMSLLRKVADFDPRGYGWSTYILDITKKYLISEGYLTNDSH